MSGQTHSVSVIIPAFNSARWIAGAVESCLRQTMATIEVIVVDDGSTDGTAGKLLPFGDRVTCMRIENGGVSRARNLGAKRSSGEWLIFLDSDDRLLPHAIESLLGAARSGSAPVAYGMVIERREPPAIAKLNGFDFCAGAPPDPSRTNLDRCAIITPGAAVVCREAFDAAGGFVPGTEPMEDRDLWLRCGLMGPIAHCDTVVLDKTWRPASHGTQAAKRIYRGWLAKRRLKAWGLERKLPVEWIPSDTVLLTGAVKEAIHWRTWEILEPLLQDAMSLGVENAWTIRARATVLALRLCGRNFSTPDWVKSSAGFGVEKA